MLQSVLAAAALYGLLYMSVLVFQTGSLPRSPKDLYKGPPANGDSPTGNEQSIEQIPSNKLKVEKINPNANWFNRPESLVVPKDNYLGSRPDIDMVANLTRLVEECRGSYEKIERMPFVYDCLKYMNEGEKEYLYKPAKGERASEQPPSRAEYLNSDGADNTLTAYPSYKSPSKNSIGQCNGPVVPYHVYWTGPATWRVELFVKSHLYTQNMPCVRLWIWLDGDREPDAIDKMMNHDRLFRKFLPLVERGDITLKLWKFPSRIPLPKGDNTDGVGYYKSLGKPNSKNETVVADGLIRDANDQEWLILSEKQKTFLPVAVSDAVRFVVLHIYGGAYFDMDVIMLKDMRPLLIGEQHGFAERWGAHTGPGDYNTAIMSLTANSSLSSYLLRGGVRMGLNFHPRIIGVMAVKDNRNHEFHMLETAAFDPIWTDFNWDRMGKCTIPCFHDYGQVFKGTREKNPLTKDEWEAYEGEQLPLASTKKAHFWEIRASKERSVEERAVVKSSGVNTNNVMFDRDALSKAEYKLEEDRYPPTNRTLENFFRGAWTYHVHNQVRCEPTILSLFFIVYFLRKFANPKQWLKNPEPSSWMNVIQRAQDGFFSHGRTNPYGEKWEGPSIPEYDLSWEFA